MSAPLEELSVSVVLPTYNRAKTIERAIASALLQEPPVVEVIVIDDGSTDDTKAIVERIRTTDSRVRYKYVDNAGACSARNHGIRLALGNLIAFQDSDDEWIAGKLARQLEVRLEKGPSLISCRHRVIFDTFKSEIRPGKEIAEESVRQSLLADNFISTQTILIDKSVLQMTDGFDLELKRLQDWDLCLQVLSLGTFPIVIDQAVLANVYRQHDSVTTNYAAYYTSLARIVRKHWRLFASHPYALFRHSLRVGKFFSLRSIRGIFG